MTDSLPIGMVATAISGSGWTCTLGTLTCTRSDALASLASYPAITVTVNVNIVRGIFGSAYPGDSNTPATLYSISPTTGAATAIGSTGFTQVGAVDMSQAGVLYGVGRRTSDNTVVLLTINPVTGAGTEVGSTGVSGQGNWPDIAFRRSDGVLFGISGGQLYTIDTTTGTATLIGSTGLGSGGNGMALSSANVLYLANGASASAKLYTIDPSTAASTLVTPLLDFSVRSRIGDCSTSYRINAMKFDPQTGTLWASVYDGSGAYFVGTVNIATGVVSKVGPTVTDLEAIVNAGAVGSSPVNKATVSGGGEVNAANDTASDVTIIIAPDLSVTKTHTGNFTQGQSGAAYTITVTNVGTAPTSGTVTMTDTLPIGMTATGLGRPPTGRPAPTPRDFTAKDASGTGWDCSTSTFTTLTCTRSDVLAAGASYPAITVTVDVGTSVAGETFGSAYAGPGSPATLYSISSANGAATPIGAIGFMRVGALDMSPGGILFGEGMLERNGPTPHNQSHHGHRHRSRSDRPRMRYRI